MILHKRAAASVARPPARHAVSFADVRSTIGYTGSVTADEVVMRYQRVRGEYRVHDGMWRLRAQGRQAACATSTATWACASVDHRYLQGRAAATVEVARRAQALWTSGSAWSMNSIRPRAPSP